MTNLQFKEELRDDLAKLVARRTVHQVLKGLNNAMIDTVRITNGGHVPTQPASASPDGASGSEDAIRKCPGCKHLFNF